METDDYAGLSTSGAGGGSINDMKDMLASLPEFQETRDKVCCLLCILRCIKSD
jgi:hypothetical protein